MDNQNKSFDFYLMPPNFVAPFLMSIDQTMMGPRRFLSKETLLANVYYSIKPEAILFLMEHKQYSAAFASSRLNELYFLPKQLGSNENINQLIEIYHLLDEHQLIEHSDKRSLLKGKKIFVYGYHREDPQLLALQKDLKLDYQFVEKSSVVDHQVYTFKNLKDEVWYTFNKIAHAIDHGTLINQITLICLDEKYQFAILEASLAFNIPINLKFNYYWRQTPIGIEFKRLLKEKKSLDEIKALFINKNNPDLDDLIAFINRLIAQARNSDHFLQYVLYLFDQLKIKQKVYRWALNHQIEPIVNLNQTVFIIGANNDLIPSFSRDTSFILNKDKHLIKQSTTDQNNELEESLWDYFFAKQTNIHISYLTYDQGHELYPSPIIIKNKWNRHHNPINHNDYSGHLKQIKLAMMLDQKRIFKVADPLLDQYRKRLAIAYQGYDYRFKPFALLKDDRHLTLSYSALNSFYTCQFKYYLDRILKIDPFEETVHLKLGRFAHHILEKSYQANFDFDIEASTFLETTPFSKKEMVAYEMIVRDLKLLIDFNKMHQAHMNVHEIKCETNVLFNIDKLTSFTGIIDKIIVTESQGQLYLALVDYKKGNEQFDKTLPGHGLSLQLPIYLYLVEQLDTYKKMKISGIYNQKISLNMKTSQELVELDAIEAASFRLNGYTLDNLKVIASLDNQLDKASKYIKSLRIKEDGQLYDDARVFTELEFKQLKKIATEKIKEAILEIRAGSFNINPKKISNKFYSCQYCPFRDICYRDNGAVIKIDVRQDESLDEVAIDAME